MFLLQAYVISKPSSALCAAVSSNNPNLNPYLPRFLSKDIKNSHRIAKPFPCLARSTESESVSDPETSPQPGTRSRRQKPPTQANDDRRMFPATIPRKPRRGRRSEADAVEDFVRDSLGRTFDAIRQQNPDVFENKQEVMKNRAESSVVEGEDEDEDEDEDDDDETEGNESDFGDGGRMKNKKKKKKMVVEEEDPDWPLDAEVGWGIRASEYFEKHAIKNVVGDDGTVIDWEGEVDDNWVMEINCLEWESFAFHPSPLVVLVFERHNRATDNWKTLKELEKAIKVYWSAKDRLPPRAVKIDVNIERDLAYALKAKECPQILFLKGNRIVYREKKFRTADELVHMIAHFYYNAKRPSWVNKTAVSPPY
ncbi:thioredoxin-like fold domain-containing protein MRL7, chloroplastic isoform X2 [Carica papaya]|uniref:thioredoxin-like fold domain-containing protein MRL7, chloroplastic isoform X2 n=1 Tax=Carica papaya TaxID=3649 RepID=UPI000B8CB367|nr:thioredoxin-like fold domain-containing protein MRL7, chloroplastic isoform X2 [Carica papaya]